MIVSERNTESQNEKVRKNMYTVYLIIPVIMFKIKMGFKVRDEFFANVFSLIFSIIGHVAIYANFAILCGVGMLAIRELNLITSFTIKQILLVALVVFGIYEIINTVVTADSGK
jgi:hypothetical protein